MIRPFFITGYPRSRTAWLANLLTYGPSFCWHEATQVFQGPSGFLAAAETRHEIYVGTADSALSLWADSLLRRYAEAPWVLVLRDREEVRESLEQTPFPSMVANTTDEILDELERGMGLLAYMPGVLRVNYEDLEDEEVCREIAAHCAPALRWDSQRWEMLHQLRVVQHDQKALETLETR